MSPLEIWYPEASEGVQAALAGRPATPWRVRFGEQRPAAYGVLVHGRPSPEQLDAESDLHSVVIPWAGLPVGTRELLLSRPHLTAYNLHHNATAVAEMVLALLLAAIRRLPEADAALRRGDWSPRYGERSGRVLAGQRALILGAGAIGKRVARWLRAMEVDVQLLRRSPREHSEFPEHGLDGLDQQLSLASILINTLPSTPATQGLLGERRLGLLQSGATFVNVGRADVAEERALFEALRTGHLGAAGLDVWYRYPDSEGARSATQPSAYDFGGLDNVVLSPHRAGHLLGTESERAEHLAQLFDALANGASAPGRVNVEAGY